MATELEVTKKQFYSQYNSLGESDSNMFIEELEVKKHFFSQLSRKNLGRAVAGGWLVGWLLCCLTATLQGKPTKKKVSNSLKMLVIYTYQIQPAQSKVWAGRLIYTNLPSNCPQTKTKKNNNFFL